MTRPYELPWYPIPPILAILFNLGIGGFLHWRDPLTGVLAASWLVLGAVIYYGLTRTGYGGGASPVAGMDSETDQAKLRNNPKEA